MTHDTTGNGSGRRIVRILLGGAVAATSVLLVLPTPAGAVINGTSDGSTHGYVGAVDGRGLGQVQFGSGVLISSTVFLTAGHGTAHFEAAGLTRARVTFDPVVTDESTWYEGTVHTNPAYAGNGGGLGNTDIGDLGVIVFDEPVPGVTPASLPTSYYLDGLIAGARAPRFEIVGYGVSRYAGGPAGGGKRRLDFSSGGTRRLATAAFASLSPSWLRLRGLGSSEICQGDSGSPSLVAGTDVVVGITDLVMSLDGGECESGAWEERIDTPAARAFLDDYVTLP